MKKFKKLIPAFCAMLLSACMLGTTTYAWFSVNKTVTATGLSVTAQAETQYFVISKTATLEDDATIEYGVSDKPTLGGINETNDDPTKNIYPAAFGQVDKTDGNKVGGTGWWTANVNVHDSIKNDDITNVRDLTATGGKNVYESNRNYFVGYTFYVGLAQNSSAFNGNLKITYDTANANAVKVAAIKLENVGNQVGDPAANLTETIEVEGTDKGAKAATGYTTSKSYALTAADDHGAAVKYVVVTVYLFVDGNDDLIRDVFEAGKLTGVIDITIAAA